MKTQKNKSQKKEKAKRIAKNLFKLAIVALVMISEDGSKGF